MRHRRRDHGGHGGRGSYCPHGRRAVGTDYIRPVTGAPFFALIERARPYCLIVDSSGSRFMNEAESYVDACHRRYQRNETVKAIPAWLVMDSNHRSRYMVGARMFKSATIKDLARQIGSSPNSLTDKVQRYNSMSRAGVDTYFGRGDNDYDNDYDSYFGDPEVGPNPNMGPLEKAPFTRFRSGRATWKRKAGS